MALAGAALIFTASCLLAYRIGHTDGRRHEAAARELVEMTRAVRADTEIEWQ